MEGKRRRRTKEVAVTTVIPEVDIFRSASFVALDSVVCWVGTPFSAFATTDMVQQIAVSREKRGPRPTRPPLFRLSSPSCPLHLIVLCSLLPSTESERSDKLGQ